MLAPDVAGRDGGLEHISGGIDLETQTQMRTEAPEPGASVVKNGQTS
ncbi:MAG: hypothetical protein QOJ78_2671 [Pseudonocardiales bacterium]|nr:hypothetical protein [Pseudonocardiales bacterium]